MSLRDIALGIDQSPEFLADIGLHQSPAKSSMSTGNKKRNYQIFEELYYSLVKYYRTALAHRPEYKVIEEVKNYAIKIVDATIMSVSLSLFQWAEYRTAKGGIKAHVSIDAATLVPEIVNISEAKVSDRRGVDNFRYPKDTIVVDDRGYFDCKLFRTRIDDENWFVTRLKDNRHGLLPLLVSVVTGVFQRMGVCKFTVLFIFLHNLQPSSAVIKRFLASG
ncbi:hypothetical protein FACS1894123_06520 [Bacteroidia bacterium]|nr:hypothetical protein FACS1894123_06520 [Bacteroidia bacterium]